MTVKYTSELYHYIFNSKDRSDLTARNWMSPLRFTLQQLRVEAWGACEFVPLNQFTLRFKVSGTLFKEYVQVIYHPFKERINISFMSIDAQGQWITHHNILGIELKDLHKFIHTYIMGELQVYPMT